MFEESLDLVVIEERSSVFHAGEYGHFLLLHFLNAKCFFESYIWICLEGDEGMERRESRFGFINKLNALSDRMESKTLERKERERREKAEAAAQRQGQKQG